MRQRGVHQRRRHAAVQVEHHHRVVGARGGEAGSCLLLLHFVKRKGRGVFSLSPCPHAPGQFRAAPCNARTRATLPPKKSEGGRRALTLLPRCRWRASSPPASGRQASTPPTWRTTRPRRAGGVVGVGTPDASTSSLSPLSSSPLSSSPLPSSSPSSPSSSSSSSSSSTCASSSCTLSSSRGCSKNWRHWKRIARRMSVTSTSRPLARARTARPCAARPRQTG